MMKSRKIDVYFYNIFVYVIKMEFQQQVCNEVRHIVYELCIREMVDHHTIPIVRHCKHYAELVKSKCNEKVFETPK